MNYSRRTFLQTISTAAIVNVHGGLVRPPVPVPEIEVVRHNGLIERLPHLLEGKASAIQLMFTDCQSTCPMQGAIFERVQRSLSASVERRVQLVSLSIDAANDTPEAMKAWLQRFHAGQHWVGATPRRTDLAAMQEFFGRGRERSDDHSTQVHLINSRAELVWRTAELPSAEEICALLHQLSQSVGV